MLLRFSLPPFFATHDDCVSLETNALSVHVPPSQVAKLSPINLTEVLLIAFITRKTSTERTIHLEVLPPTAHAGIDNDYDPDDNVSSHVSLNSSSKYFPSTVTTWLAIRCAECGL